jgi:hypothetical protein
MVSKHGQVASASTTVIRRCESGYSLPIQPLHNSTVLALAHHSVASAADSLRHSSGYNTASRTVAMEGSTPWVIHLQWAVVYEDARVREVLWPGKVRAPKRSGHQVVRHVRHP